MKNFKSFILFTLIGIFAGFLVSCGNRNEKDIIALKKLSTERAEKSIKKFEDEYTFERMKSDYLSMLNHLYQ